MSQLYGGSLGNFDIEDSMAKDIEEELSDLRIAEGLGPLPAGDSRDRRIFFLAIARGVIRHLKEKEDAFHVSVAVNGAHNHNATTTLDVKPDV
jgi:hypothetical protein